MWYYRVLQPKIEKHYFQRHSLWNRNTVHTGGITRVAAWISRTLKGIVDQQPTTY